MSEKKKSKRGRPKKPVKEMTQTHGMVEGEKYEPTTLDQVWGDDGLSKYSTMDAKVYQEKVDNWLLADLKNEAIRVGLLPVDNAEMLKDRLVREFSVHVSSYRKPSQAQENPSQPSADIQKILREGR